jgi:hypothetical protein
MSVLLPIMPGQLERWSRPRPEPVTLELPGWITQVREPDATFPNERRLHFEKGGASVELLRYWDQPRNPGRPMVVASEADAMVAGRPARLLTTSMFDGVTASVKVCWLTGEGHDVEYGVRIVFRGCSDDTIGDALARVHVAW